MDFTVDSYTSKMIKAITIISVLMMVIGAAFFRSSLAIGFVIGVAMSMGLNIVKALWLRHSVSRAVNMEQAAGTAYIAVMHVLRFVATGLVLVAAHFLPFTDMFGAAVGLLSMPFANYAVNFLGRRGAASEPTAKTNDDDNTDSLENKE